MIGQFDTSSQSIGKRLQVDLRAWSWLTMAGIIACAALIPVVVDTYFIQSIPAVTVEQLPLLGFALLVGGVLVASLTYFGLRLSRLAGVEIAPVLEVKQTFGEIFRPAVLIGVGSGVIVAILNRLIPIPALFPAPHSLPSLDANLIKAFYGGIFEELCLRLLAIPLIAILIFSIEKTISQKMDWAPRKPVMWLAISLVALLYGCANLAVATQYSQPFTIYIAVRVLLTHSILGLAFGWCFWRKGIEAAILAHLTTNLFLLVF
jgi:hypothetical protein